MAQLLRSVRPGQIWLILLTILTVLAGGLSGLVYRSTYSPLIFLAGIGAVFVGLACLKKPVLALYIALFVGLLPVGVIPENIHSILNRSLAVLAIAVWCLDAIFVRRKISLAPSAVAMLIFLTWAILTLLWASEFSPAVTTLQVFVLRFLLFLFLVPNEIKTQKSLDKLLNTLSFSGWVLIAFSVFTLLSQGYEAGTRFKLFNVNENSIGVMALLALSPVLLQASSPSGRRTWRTIMALIFMLMTVGLVGISGSRGSYISLLITVTAFWFWKSSRKWGELGFAILLLGIMAAPLVFETTIDRFVELSGGSILAEREVLWQAAWKMIGHHPLVGVGIGNSSYSIMPYLDVLASSAGRENASLHNPILVIWSETGLVGIILYLAIPVCAGLSFITQYMKYRKYGQHPLIPYFAFISALFLGYVASWIKGGGMETDFIYFLIIALLLIPSGIHIDFEISRVNTPFPNEQPSAFGFTPK